MRVILRMLNPLVVDDELLIRSMLDAHLSVEGYEVIQAENDVAGSLLDIEV